MKTVINTDMVHESSLNTVDQNAATITLSPSATLYRGYQKHIIQTDTFHKFRWDVKRSLYFGTRDHAFAYSLTDISEDDRFGGDGLAKGPIGPLYRFWAKRPLKLLSLNKETAKSLVKDFLDNDDPLNAGRLIFAYGYMNNMQEGCNIVKELKKRLATQKYQRRLNDLELVIDHLETALDKRLDLCEEMCTNEQYTVLETLQIQRMTVVTFCRQHCLKEEDILGRSSKFEIDKPLVVELRDMLVARGYDGIIAWVDRTYSSYAHDIIIFDFAKKMESDNVDLNKADRRRRSVKLEIVPPILTRGPTKGRLPADWNPVTYESPSYINKQIAKHRKELQKGKGKGKERKSKR